MIFLANITSGEVNLLGPFGLLVGPNYSRTQSTPRTGHQRNMPTKASALTGWPYYCHVQEKVRGKQKFSRSGKTFAIVKVSEWGNYISGYSSYVLHGDSEMHLVRKRMKSTLQSEQSDYFFILSCPTCVVVVVSCFRCKCFPPSKYMRRFIRHKRDLKHRQRNKRQRRFASLSSAASFTDNDFFFAKNFVL